MNMAHSCDQSFLFLRDEYEGASVDEGNVSECLTSYLPGGRLHVLKLIVLAADDDDGDPDGSNELPVCMVSKHSGRFLDHLVVLGLVSDAELSRTFVYSLSNGVQPRDEIVDQPGRLFELEGSVSRDLLTLERSTTMTTREEAMTLTVIATSNRGVRLLPPARAVSSLKGEKAHRFPTCSVHLELDSW